MSYGKDERKLKVERFFKCKKGASEVWKHRRWENAWNSLR